MKKIFKNKCFIVLLGICVVLPIFSLVFRMFGVSPLITKAIGNIGYPFELAFSKVTEQLDGYRQYLSSADRLIEENRQLKEENDDLRRQLASREYASEEIDFLKTYFGMKEKDSRFEAQEATVIATSGGSFSGKLTLNKGSVDGISENMPVITSAGLVGYVTEVGYRYCVVATILETNISVIVIDDAGGERGVLEGRYQLAQEKKAAVKDFSETATVNVGDLIVTAGGKKGIYPAGIAVGTVESVVINSYSRTKEAVISPIVDFDALTKVMIVKNFSSAPVEER